MLIILSLVATMLLLGMTHRIAYLRGQTNAIRRHNDDLDAIAGELTRDVMGRM